LERRGASKDLVRESFAAVIVAAGEACVQQRCGRAVGNRSPEGALAASRGSVECRDHGFEVVDHRALEHRGQ